MDIIKKLLILLLIIQFTHAQYPSELDRLKKVSHKATELNNFKDIMELYKNDRQTFYEISKLKTKRVFKSKEDEKLIDFLFSKALDTSIKSELVIKNKTIQIKSSKGVITFSDFSNGAKSFKVNGIDVQMNESMSFEKFLAQFNNLNFQKRITFTSLFFSESHAFILTLALVMALSGSLYVLSGSWLESKLIENINEYLEVCRDEDKSLPLKLSKTYKEIRKIQKEVSDEEFDLNQTHKQCREKLDDEKLISFYNLFTDMIDVDKICKKSEELRSCLKEFGNKKINDNKNHFKDLPIRDNFIQPSKGVDSQNR